MQRAYSVQEQLYRSQWSAFIRNLIVFENAKWINNPVSIYKAENKMLQLQVAQQSGLLIPKTFVGNTHPIGINPEAHYIVKSIDTALFYDQAQEMFTYSSMLSGEELMSAELSSAPVMIQECIQNKLDIRVTVIGELQFAVSITKEGKLIDGDWRRTQKDHLLYEPMDLPQPIFDSIKKLMKSLNLSFGGVDLVLSNGVYRFIEVNPTGEWGWLVSMAKLPIDIAIAEELSMGVVV
jgi:glutathione synthase/RimK-type ligase-like ATP-grasp enzyme